MVCRQKSQVMVTRKDVESVVKESYVYGLIGSGKDTHWLVHSPKDYAERSSIRAVEVWFL